VDIICPSSVPAAYGFLKGYAEIKQVDYRHFDFSGYDLWPIPDASNWWQISGIPNFLPPELKVINFDHHATKDINFPLSLVESGLSSTCELLYLVFEDWRITLDQEIAELLLTGIVGDTGAFRYSNVTAETLRITTKLMGLGADKNMAVFRTYGSISFKEIKYWGKIIEVMKEEKEDRFVWAAVDFPAYTKYGQPIEAGSSAASNFAGVVEATDFGVFMTEEKERFLSCNFRGRGGFDVSQIARALGGGGHKEAAGARITGLPFNEAVEKVLAVCRKYAQKNS
jgi:phosphoesterase RecJ-like protein